MIATQIMRKRKDTPARGGGTAEPLRYAADYHVPVLWKAVVDGLVTDPGGTYVDATLGGGGHSAALLDALGDGGTVVGVDRDAEALEAAGRRLAHQRESGRFRALYGNFGDLKRTLAADGIEAVDGLLLDLGLSSHQIDEASRGFSYREEAPLDMRMDTTRRRSAHEVVNTWDESALRQILSEYGEEPRSRKIAWAVVHARPIDTTTALADIVRQVVPLRDEVKSLSRVFQAIRIAVNSELEALEQCLSDAVDLVRTGGRMAVISYHSLEDRRVKRYFRYGNLKGEPVRDVYGNLLAPWQELNRRPLMADEAEVTANPRARSARLRIAERVDVKPRTL